MLFHEQVSGIFEAFVVEIELTKIALSCHFALDLLCFKEGAYDSTWEFIGHHCPWNFFLLSGTIATFATSWFPCGLTLTLQHFASISVWRLLVATQRTHLYDVAQHLLYILNLESSTQVWYCTHLRVWTRDPWWIWSCSSSREHSRYLFAAPCSWLPTRTPSSVEVFLKLAFII